MFFLFLASLFGYRVCRFIVEDTIFDGLRESLTLRLLGWPRLVYLLTCFWCLGVWVAGVTVLVASFFVDVSLPVFMWLAVSVLIPFWCKVDKFLDKLVGG